MEKMTTALLRAENIAKSYENKPVLRNISLEIFPGKTIAIMGKSGCGKTTLLNLLGGLDRPDSGGISFCGTKLTPGKLRRYRRDHVGFLFQSSGLIEEFTAVQNVSAAISIAGSGADPMEYLSMVGLSDCAKAYPRQLSGGQGHRVALARALAKKPRLLLLDEPTEGLDRATGQEIIDLTLTLCRENGIAAVVVTHREEHALQMDRCVTLTDGLLIEGVLP